MRGRKSFNSTDRIVRFRGCNRPDDNERLLKFLLQLSFTRVSGLLANHGSRGTGSAAREEAPVREFPALQVPE